MTRQHLPAGSIIPDGFLSPPMEVGIMNALTWRRVLRGVLGKLSATLTMGALSWRVRTLTEFIDQQCRLLVTGEWQYEHILGFYPK